MRPFLKNKAKHFEEKFRIKNNNSKCVSPRARQENKKIIISKQNTLIDGKSKIKPGLKNVMESARVIIKKYLQLGKYGQKFHNVIKKRKETKQSPIIELLSPATELSSPKLQNSVIEFKPEIVSTPIEVKIEFHYKELCSVVNNASEACFNLLFKEKVPSLIEIKQQLFQLYWNKIKASEKSNENQKIHFNIGSQCKINNMKTLSEIPFQNPAEKKSSPCVFINSPNTILCDDSNKPETKNFEDNNHTILGFTTFCYEFENNISQPAQLISDINIPVNIFDSDEITLKKRSFPQDKKSSTFPYLNPNTHDINESFQNSIESSCSKHKSLNNIKSYSLKYCDLNDNLRNINDNSLKEYCFTPISSPQRSPQYLPFKHEATPFITQLNNASEISFESSSFYNHMNLSALNGKYKKLKRSHTQICQRQTKDLSFINNHVPLTTRDEIPSKIQKITTEKFSYTSSLNFDLIDTMPKDVLNSCYLIKNIWNSHWLNISSQKYVNRKLRESIQFQDNNEPPREQIKKNQYPNHISKHKNKTLTWYSQNLIEKDIRKYKQSTDSSITPDSQIKNLSFAKNHLSDYEPKSKYDFKHLKGDKKEIIKKPCHSKRFLSPTRCPETYRNRLDDENNKQKNLKISTIQSTIPSVQLEKSSANCLQKIFEWNLRNLKLIRKDNNE